MKKCPNCGKEYPDDALVCAFDVTKLVSTEIMAGQVTDPIATRRPNKEESKPGPTEGPSDRKAKTIVFLIIWGGLYLLIGLASDNFGWGVAGASFCIPALIYGALMLQDKIEPQTAPPISSESPEDSAATLSTATTGKPTFGGLSTTTENSQHNDSRSAQTNRGYPKVAGAFRILAGIIILLTGLVLGGFMLNEGFSKKEDTMANLKSLELQGQAGSLFGPALKNAENRKPGNTMSSSSRPIKYNHGQKPGSDRLQIKTLGWGLFALIGGVVMGGKCIIEGVNQLRSPKQSTSQK